MSEQEYRSLEQINSATLGASMPVVTLPSGHKVQTGTVGALLINIKRYDVICTAPSQDVAEKQRLEEAMSASMHSQRKVGIFEFSPQPRGELGPVQAGDS